MLYFETVELQALLMRAWLPQHLIGWNLNQQFWNWASSCISWLNLIRFHNFFICQNWRLWSQNRAPSLISNFYPKLNAKGWESPRHWTGQSYRKSLSWPRLRGREDETECSPGVSARLISQLHPLSRPCSHLNLSFLLSVLIKHFIVQWSREANCVQW